MYEILPNLNIDLSAGLQACIVVDSAHLNQMFSFHHLRAKTPILNDTC